MYKKTIIVLILVSSIVLSSCKYQKLLKSSNAALKYEKAIEYYEKEDYFKASQLLDELIIIYRGTTKTEKIYFYYAYCHYYQDQYILASYHFKQFAKSFPKSKYTEECLFMSAYCTFLESPKYNLDQTNTKDAIRELQLFVDLYPKSERVKECNKLIDELWLKLENKDYEIAKLYFKTSYYKASIYAFKNLLKEFPSTKYKEEALFYILKASYEYATNSVEAKKYVRLKDTIEAYNALLKFFPDGEFIKDANSIKKITLKELSKFEPQNSI